MRSLLGLLKVLGEILIVNLLNKYWQLGIFSTSILLLTGLSLTTVGGNAIERSQIKLALQETIPRQYNDAQERQQQWQQQQKNIEQQRIQRQRSQFQENRQRSQTYQNRLETNKQQFQRSQQRQNDLRQRVQQQQQQYQDRLRQRQILAPSPNYK